MSPKERLLAAIRGEEVDRLPWSPFLAYWWEAQPSEIQGMGQFEFLKAMGADPLLRGHGMPFTVEYPGTETVAREDGPWRHTELRTPWGELHYTHLYSPAGDTWFIQEHPLKTEADWRTLLRVTESAIVKPSLKAVADDKERFGEEALALPLVGAHCKTGFQSLVEHWAGTMGLTFALADWPDAVESVIDAMRSVDIATSECAALSEADAFIFWEDSSTTNISPAWFEKYTAPTIRAWGDVLHSHGKLLVHHACGTLRGFLPHLATLPIDALESISPPPTGDVELWEARKAMGPDIALVGGIEPTVFLNSTLPELDACVDELVTRVGMKGFILANSDSCPPGVSMEKFSLVTDKVRGLGARPRA